MATPMRLCLTEKAVVLNRIGKLSYQLGLLDEALDYMRKSLSYTLTLNLKYGTSVNLYNISRLAAERVLAHQPIDWSIIETLVTGIGYPSEYRPEKFSHFLRAHQYGLLTHESSRVHDRQSSKL